MDSSVVSADQGIGSSLSASPDGTEMQSEGRVKKMRSRDGCLNCRQKRRKCDESRPVCKNCRRRNDVCQWGVQLIFRPENARGIEKNHPSMQMNGSRKRSRPIQIVDVTPEVARDHQHSFAMDLQTPNSPSEQVATPTEGTSNVADYVVFGVHGSQHAPFSSPQTTNIYRDSRALHTADTPIALDKSSTNHGLAPEIQSFSSPIDEQSPGFVARTQSAAAHLLSLRNTIDHQLLSPDVATVTESPESFMMPMGVTRSISTQTAACSDGLFEDGIFLPGSTYQQLHATLRDHIFSTARSAHTTREGSPEDAATSMDSGVNSSQPINTERQRVGDVVPLPQYLVPASNPPGLDSKVRYELWKNYIEEVAPWLDKFDNECHFSNHLPCLAKSNPHLEYSILALSARQLERKEAARGSSESLALYQQAIHLLLPHIETKNTAVIASCVVLCVLEMMSCAPKEWRRHLDGCANLMQVVRINGVMSGTEQALFWCFARMDVCGGLISSDRTLIPSHEWASRLGFAEDVRLFRSIPTFDMYANFMVYLCSRTLDLLADRAHKAKARALNYIKRWTELLEHIEDWYGNRPEVMKPILYFRSSPSNLSKPFPTILYGNAPAVSGNQLYHTAMVLMLQTQPRNYKPNRKPQSILWHARRICAISISNTHHGCWTNSVQPLWIAGKVMSHPAEHQAILDVYERIEVETGWGANWRAKDLQEFWGTLDE